MMRANRHLSSRSSEPHRTPLLARNACVLLLVYIHGMKIALGSRAIWLPDAALALSPRRTEYKNAVHGRDWVALVSVGRIQSLWDFHKAVSSSHILASPCLRRLRSCLVIEALKEDTRRLVRASKVTQIHKTVYPMI